MWSADNETKRERERFRERERERQKESERKFERQSETEVFVISRKNSATTKKKITENKNTERFADGQISRRRNKIKRNEGFATNRSKS